MCLSTPGRSGAWAGLLGEEMGCGASGAGSTWWLLVLGVLVPDKGLAQRPRSPPSHGPSAWCQGAQE